MTLLIILASGWSPADYLPVYKNLRADIVTQLNDLFDREISVESVSGILVNQLELNNVEIAREKKLSEGTIIKAKKIVINYNPFKLAASSGNITAAISKIVIIEPEILVERSIHDEWNMAGLIPKVKSIDATGESKPMLINATVLVKGGYGKYIDHMGFGEDLKGKPFVSGMRDVNAEVRISGNRINISKATATSVVDRSLAYASVNGNLNARTGKYRFVVVAKNVDIEKWGYYTLNIPDFKPISGLSDMRMTMTNPPPRKKGLPILFDGKFYIKNGKAIVFGQPIEKMNGFVSVYDEDARCRNLSGFKDKVALNVNGRLFDFSVANYDVNIDAPSTDSEKLKRAFPQLSGVDFSGKMGAKVHVGGNYGHPLFGGKVSLDGYFIKQKMSGDLDFTQEGSVLRFNSSNISAYGGNVHASSIVDFTTSIPNIDIHLSGEALTVRDILPIIAPGQKVYVEAEVKGSMQRFSINGRANTTGEGEITASGTYETNNIELNLSGKGLSLVYNKYFTGKLENFTGKLYGNLNKNLAIEGNLALADPVIGNQPFSRADAAFKLKNNVLDISSLVLKTDNSSVHVKGQTGIGCATNLLVQCMSAEASDLKIIDALLPRELRPLSGKLDIDISLSGFITNEADFDPFKLKINGKVSIRDGAASYEKIKEAAFNLNWSGAKLSLKDSKIKTLSSDLALNGTYEANGKLNMDITGDLDLADLKPFTLKYGRLFGSAKLTCHLEGRIGNPGADVDFDMKNFRYNDIMIDRIYGRAVYDGANIFLAKPLEIDHAQDNYVISGKFSTLKKPAISLRFEVIKGDLDTAFSLFDAINTELSSKRIFGQSYGQKPITLNVGKFQFPGKNFDLLYKSEGNKTPIEEIKKAERETLTFSTAAREKVKRNIFGKFSGYLEVKGDYSNPSGQLVLRFSSGTWESYTFDEAQIKTRLEGGTFEVGSAYIKKGDGLLSIQGIYNPSTIVSLEIKADKMPIDFMSLFLGEGKKFNGNFNMNAYIRGPVSSPYGYADISSDKVNIANIAFERIEGAVTYANDRINLKKIELTTGDKKASISGILPLMNEDISIQITTEGESIGLLTIALKDVSWISGSGHGSVRISGKSGHPRLDGNIVLDNAAINLKMLGSNLESINSSVNISNNSLSTEGLWAKWIGDWTQGHVNKIKISGILGFDGLFMKDKSLDFDLKLADTSLVTDFPNLYRGDLEVKNLSFKGPLSFSPENPRAPELSGTFSLNNGTIILPDMTKKISIPPIGLDMTLNIQKNTYVVAGDVKNLISTDLSNLLLNLEIEGQNIAVSGRLDNPKITGKTLFKHGTVNLLNREFSLMNEDRQKTLFGSNLEKVKENSAVFSGTSLPNLSLAAEVTVKSVERIGETNAGETPAYKTINVLVVSRITGVPFSEDKDLGIKLAFDAFTEDTTKQPSDFLPGKYDEQEIKVLLLPDFIKGPLGISEKGVEQVDANDVLVDYMNSRLNSYLLRGVERNLAKSLDLESLTLEYNFGKDLRNMLPARSPAEISPYQMPETMYGIGAVKGFFERFYIDVKYSQAVEEQAVINKSFLNYQLTYKLSPVLSVVYYREPFSFIEPESDYYKVTLKAGYQL